MDALDGAVDELDGAVDGCTGRGKSDVEAAVSVDGTTADELDGTVDDIVDGCAWRGEREAAAAAGVVSEGIARPQDWDRFKPLEEIKKSNFMQAQHH